MFYQKDDQKDFPSKVCWSLTWQHRVDKKWTRGKVGSFINIKLSFF